MELASAQPAMAAASPTPDPPVCYFIDRLAAETRIRIYQFVFGPGARAHRYDTKPCTSEIVNEVDSEEDDDPDDVQFILEPGLELRMPDDAAQSTTKGTIDIPTDIFAVNKLVHKESIEAFYNNKIVSVSFHQFDRLLLLEYPRLLLRDVEITDCCRFAHHTGFVKEHLLEVQALPRLKTFTIRSEYLAQSEDPEDFITVREFVDYQNLGSLICTDVGKYTLCGQFSKIKFAHDKILKMWPNVASTPDNYNAFEEALMAGSSFNVSGPLSNYLAWASHTSLRLWVGLLQAYYDTEKMHEEDNDSVSFDERVHLNAFGMSAMRGSAVARQIPIRKLDSTHKTEWLEDVTEMLSMNIQFYHLTNGFERFYRQPQWVELGEECEGTRQGRYQEDCRKATAEYYKWEDPIDGHYWEQHTMHDELYQDPTTCTVHVGMEILNSSREKLHSMFALHYAMDWVKTPVDRTTEQTAAFEEWSSELLKRHLHFARVQHDELIEQVPLHKLRGTFQLAMSLSQAYEDHRFADPGEQENETDEEKRGREAKADLRQLATAMHAALGEGLENDDGEFPSEDSMDDLVCKTLIRSSVHFIRGVWEAYCMS